MAKTSVPPIWKSSEEPSFSRQYALTIDDHLAISFSSRDFLHVWPYAATATAVLLFASLIYTFDDWQSGRIGRFLLINCLVVAAGLFASWLFAGPVRRLAAWFTRRQLLKAERIGDLIDITVNRHGVSTIWRGQSAHAPWETLVSVEEDDGTFYFWVTKQIACVWPRRLFETGDERAEFRRKLTEWAGYAPVSPPFLANLGDLGRRNLDAASTSLPGNHQTDG